MSETPITMEEIRRRGFDPDVMHVDRCDAVFSDDEPAQDAVESGDIFSKREKAAHDAREQAKYERWRKANPPSPTEVAISALFETANAELVKLATKPLDARFSRQKKVGALVGIALPKDYK